MPYCPKCRDEFQDWVKVCPGCQVALVDELPALSEIEKIRIERRNDPLVHVATASNEAVAGMWQ
ncbi:MAG: hypothetical protein PHU23_14535 [Dehalococcoidales bacterium]|nr:hypothetical protein [Dehalococcoidales bacterium]